MNKFLEVVAGVPNEVRLSALAIAAILFIVQRHRKPSAIAWFALFAILTIGIAPFLASAYVQRTLNLAIYRIRITVLDPQGVPVENATVWSSAGGEPKRVPGGWEFDLPSESKPLDGNLTLYASIREQFLQGSRRLTLAADHNPAVEITLAKAATTTVRGLVTDAASRSISGAWVSVVGYDSEGSLTGPSGSFTLPAHCAAGEQVRLHVEKLGYRPVDQLHPAGDAPATIVLDRKDVRTAGTGP